MVINGGNSNLPADVTAKKELYIHGNIESMFENAVSNGEAFDFVASALAATGADDCVIYIENGEDVDIVVDRVHLGDASAAVGVYVKSGVKAASALNSPTAITPRNKHIGNSGVLSESTIQKGADLDNASVLAHSAEHRRVYLQQDVEDLTVNLGLRIPKGYAISVWATGTAAVNYSFEIHKVETKQ